MQSWWRNQLEGLTSVWKVAGSNPNWGNQSLAGHICWDSFLVIISCHSSKQRLLAPICPMWDECAVKPTFISHNISPCHSYHHGLWWVRRWVTWTYFFSSASRKAAERQPSFSNADSSVGVNFSLNILISQKLPDMYSFLRKVPMYCINMDLIELSWRPF